MRWIFEFLQNIGLGQGKLGKDGAAYLLFSMEVTLPSMVPKLSLVKPRYYCQAQIDQNLPTHENTLQEGTITFKKDLSELPIRRKLCAQPRKDRQWSYAFPPHKLEEIDVDNAPDEAMRILEQALDLV